MKVLKSYWRVMPEGLQQYLSETVQPMTLKKGELLSKDTTVSEFYYFVEKGLIRCFAYDKRRQQTHYFKRENEFIVDGRDNIQSSYMDEFYFEALEDCTIWLFPETLNDPNFPHCIPFSRYARIIMEIHIVKYYQRSRLIRHQNIGFWLDYIRQNEPDLLSRVPLKYLASYVGTTQVILRHAIASTIKMKMSTKTRRKGKRNV